jgi:hypothetical protein
MLRLNRIVGCVARSTTTPLATFLRSSHRCYHTDHTNAASPTEAQKDIHQMLNTPSWSIRTLLDPRPDAEPVTDDAVLDRVLRLAGLDVDSSPEEREGLARDLTALRHFVQHVQDAKIPPDTEPLARLCEWHWTPEAADTTTPSIEAEVHGRALLKHAARLASDTYYTAPAPTSFTFQYDSVITDDPET